MHQGKYIFAQIIEFLPRYSFEKFVKIYHGDKRIRSLTCRDQLLAMMFGQLANLKSLRSIVLCLNAHPTLLYHLGFTSRNLARSTLAYANENRDYRIYQDLSQLLIKKAQKLYANDNDFKIELNGAVYALDSTVVELCLNTFKWANFDQEVAAVKIHTQFNLKGNIPAFFLITKGKIPDVKFLDMLRFEEKAFYIMDRGYVDYKRLFNIHTQKAFFVIRPKKNIAFKRMYSLVIDKSTGICCDQIIKFKDRTSRKRYPEKLRRVKYYDKETNRYYVFLSNNFILDTKAITDLYKHRWQIELFFKWIKQHLRIEVFWGCSANAVKTQICIAMCTFLIVAIMKRELKIKRSLYEILQILAVTQFEKTPINTVLFEEKLQNKNELSKKQLTLFNT